MNAIRRHVVVVVVTLIISGLALPAAAQPYEALAERSTVTSRFIELVRSVIAEIRSVWPQASDSGESQPPWPGSTDKIGPSVDPGG